MTDDVIAEVPTAGTNTPEPISTETATDATPNPEQATQEAAQPQRTFNQDEVDKIVQKRVAKEKRHVERAAAAERELELLREQIARQQQAERPQPQGKPTPDQFQDYESYIDALSDWKVDQKLGALRAESEQAQQARIRAERAEAARTRLMSGADRFEDFDAVVNNPALPITQAMADAIVESDMGSDIAYFLGTNLAEAQQISRLSPVAQIRAIAALETRLKAPPKPTEAPEPITPASAKAKSDKTPSEMTPKEFAEWRKGYIKKRHV